MMSPVGLRSPLLNPKAEFFGSHRLGCVFVCLFFGF